MFKTVLGLTLAALTHASLAASDPQCAEYEKLRNQRDSALGAKNFKQYCGALASMVKLMPEKPPERARLQCEFNAATMTVDTWLGIRPSVISMMKETFDQQCK